MTIAIARERNKKHTYDITPMCKYMIHLSFKLLNRKRNHLHKRRLKIKSMERRITEKKIDTKNIFESNEVQVEREDKAN